MRSSDWPAKGLYTITEMPLGWNCFIVREYDGSLSHRYFYILNDEDAKKKGSSCWSWLPNSVLYLQGQGWKKSYWWNRVIWNLFFPHPKPGVDF